MRASPETTIHQLYVAATMCKHDVRRLDVAVYYLLGVHILHSIKQLSSYLMYHLFSHLAAFHSRLKRLAVHIFHDNAVAQFAHWLHAYSAADVGMIELQSYLKLLHQRLTIHRRITKIRLQAFQYITLAISHGCEHTCMARLRHIALADNRKKLTAAIYKYLFNNLFIIIDFKFCNCRIITFLQNYTIYVNTTSS